MSDLYRVFTDDADLPDDGLLAVAMRNPDEKPRIRLVPVTIDYAAHERMVQRFIGYLNQGGTVGTSIDEVGVLSREMVAAAIGDVL